MFQRRLIRIVITGTFFMFVVFQFHTTTGPDAWPERAFLRDVNTTAVNETSEPSPLVRAEIDEKESESLFEKIEYAIVKFFMGKILAAHERRQEAAAALRKVNNSVAASVEKRIMRMSLGNIKNDADEYKHSKIDNLSSSHGYLPTSNSSTSTKLILLYTRFFGRRNWTPIFGNSSDLISHHCPETNCVFTLDQSQADVADALIFHDRDFRISAIPRIRKPQQRYIWLYHEAPGMENTALKEVPRGFFNWTYTYHRESDILLLYGGLRSLKGDGQWNAIRPGLLNISGETYLNYITTLGENETSLTDLLDDTESDDVILQGSNSTSEFLDGRKLLSWMVSHCSTWSGRELYIKKLSQYVDIDIYGKCGNLSCGRDHHDIYCYSRVLSSNYLFYLSFENSMCADYITEKVWYPLHYGLVPVVYGGATYKDYLPPQSYIDATNLSPKQLAALLIKIGTNSTLYQKFHSWRDYWQVVIPPPMCELCQRLHKDHSPSTVYDPHKWWIDVNNCTTRYPFDKYPRQDLRLIVDKVDMGVKLFRNLLASLL
ncbi:COP9 signalosome complex subunit 2 [Halocaridina rubra]|uniref:Fucosyltransferase n=1 Tax=Halocaridina rubra TaxID=373956 RepID=A0AAN8WQ50_HALRR